MTNYKYLHEQESFTGHAVMQCIHEDDMVLHAEVEECYKEAVENTLKLGCCMVGEGEIMQLQETVL